MKKALRLSGIFAIITFLFASCTVTPDQLADQLKPEIQKFYKNEGKDYMTITDVTLSQKNETEYTGTVTAKYEDTEYQSPIKVTLKGSEYKWEVDRFTFEIAEEVKTMIIEENTDIANLEVNNLILAHKSDNIYTGTVELSGEGEHVTAGIEVVWDGESIVYEIDFANASFTDGNGNKITGTDISAEAGRAFRFALLEEASNQGLDIQVENVNLTFQSGTTFTGNFNLTDNETGDVSTINVTVTYDGENVAWEMEE